MISPPRPSRFSVCIIEKLGVAWGQGYNTHTCTCTNVYIHIHLHIHVRVQCILHTVIHNDYTHTHVLTHSLAGPYPACPSHERPCVRDAAKTGPTVPYQAWYPRPNSKRPSTQLDWVWDASRSIFRGHSEGPPAEWSNGGKWKLPPQAKFVQSHHGVAYQAQPRQSM